MDRTAIVWVRPWELFNYYSIKTNRQLSQWKFNLKGEVGSGTRETFTPWPCRSYFSHYMAEKHFRWSTRLKCALLNSSPFLWTQKTAKFCTGFHTCLILLGSIPEQPGLSLRDIRWSGQMTVFYIWTHFGTAFLVLKHSLNPHHL